jgi:hypothetical protein
LPALHIKTLGAGEIVNAVAALAVLLLPSPLYTTETV